MLEDKKIKFLPSSYTKSNDTQQEARKFKNVLAKKLVKTNIVKKFFREIAFLALLNFSPDQKLIFGFF